MRRRTMAVLGMVIALGAGPVAADDDEEKATTAQTRGTGRVETAGGLAISWGISTSLLELRALRDPSEPGRLRSYEMTPEALPGSVGFLVSVDPTGRPFEIEPRGGGDFQLISVAFMLTAQYSTDRPEQSAVSLGLGISFFERILGFAVTFDVYRGVPILGVDQEGTLTEGAGTAETGLLGWAFAEQGEVTAENFGLILFFDVVGFATALGGV